MSERIIVILETVAIVVLSIVVVIYAQVLWQRFQTAPQVIEQTVQETEETGAAATVSDEARIETLKALSDTAASDITADERKDVLEKLAPAADTVEADTAARMQVLESLQNN